MKIQNLWKMSNHCGSIRNQNKSYLVAKMRFEQAYEKNSWKGFQLTLATIFMNCLVFTTSNYSNRWNTFITIYLRGYIHVPSISLLNDPIPCVSLVFFCFMPKRLNFFLVHNILNKLWPEPKGFSFNAKASRVMFRFF